MVSTVNTFNNFGRTYLCEKEIDCNSYYVPFSTSIQLVLLPYMTPKQILIELIRTDKWVDQGPGHRPSAAQLSLMIDIFICRSFTSA